MEEVLKVLNEHILCLQRQVEWAKEDKAKAEARAKEANEEVECLKQEIEHLKSEISFYKPKGA
jgi:FtsZ-binding cell division protein ZapB